MPRGRGRRGFALVVVLWLAIILGLLAGSVATTSVSGLRASNAGLRTLQAEMAADGALWIGVQQLHQRGSRAWLLNGTVYGWRMAGHETRVRITDEFGRFDLNRTPTVLLADLLRAAGLADDAAIQTAEAIAALRQDRAAARVKQDPSLARWANHGVFAEPEELLAVPGISPGLYARLADAVTVHSAQTKPTLGLTNALVRKTLGMREADNEGAGLAAPAPETRDAPVALNAPEIETNGFSGLVRVEAEAMAPDGTRFARLAIIRLPNSADEPVRTLAWRRGQSVLFDPER